MDEISQTKMTTKNESFIKGKESLKIVDATLRDGGLVTNFNFSESFVRDLYLANCEAGIDYMEFGYRASKVLFNPSTTGRWRFTDEQDLRDILNEKRGEMKLSIMMDVGKCDCEKDLLPRENSLIDLVRVACYIDQIPTAKKIIYDAKAKGYEVACNIMAISKASEDETRVALETLANSEADIIYLVDSFGRFYPNEVAKKIELFSSLLKNKKIGFHGHNNQQLAFANTIEAYSHGCDFLDVTIGGIGRGAGNCSTEQWMVFMKKSRRQILPILNFISKHSDEIFHGWGYSLAHLLTGAFNIHPSKAIEFLNKNRADYAALYDEIAK